MQMVPGKKQLLRELDKLIALLLYFGLVSVGTHFDQYWSTNTLFHGLWARAILPRIRYRALMAFLHVVDPETEAPGDKLRKVDSFIAYFKTRCLSLYQPRRHIAVDERMVKSRHSSGIRQYIKDKPTTDSHNGYTTDFNVYIGKSAGRTVSENGLGYDVVMKLMQPFLHQGYYLFFDNFYTSVTLVKDLFDLGVLATGIYYIAIYCPYVREKPKINEKPKNLYKRDIFFLTNFAKRSSVSATNFQFPRPILNFPRPILNFPQLLTRKHYLLIWPEKLKKCFYVYRS